MSPMGVFAALLLGFGGGCLIVALLRALDVDPPKEGVSSRGKR